jgi:acetoin:2,6-dichlorophenolindophenol oxidoreductase subunit alpha
VENLREEKDCLKLFADRVVSAGLVDKEELEKIDEQVRTLIDEAVEEAKAAPDPKENDLLTDVYVSY